MSMKKFIFAVLFVFTYLLSISSAWGVVVDDVMEACIKSGLKQAGKNSDEVADILRKTGGTFSNILQSDPDYLRRATQLLDNDTIGLGKKLSKIDDAIDITKTAGRQTDNIADVLKGGRHADDVVDVRKVLSYGDDVLEMSNTQLEAFKNFTKGQKAMAISLQSTITRIVKMPEGTEIITKMGRKGLVLGATYGDEALRSAYNLNKSGAVSLISEVKHISDGDILKLIKESNMGIPLVDAGTLRRMGNNIDAVDVVKNVAKRYGPIGAKNVSNFCADIAKGVVNFAYNNPKKTLAGIVIATIYFKPHLIVDSAGNLLANATEIVAVGTAKGLGRAAGTVMTLPSVAADALLDGWIPNAPLLIKGILKPIVWLFIFITICYIIPPTRFIAKAILAFGKYIINCLYSFVRSFSAKKKVETGRL